MEKLFDILLKAGPVAAVLGLVAYVFYLMYKKKDKECIGLLTYISELHKEMRDREREISDERRSDMNIMIEGVNSSTNVIKNQTDAFKELSKEIRYNKG